jgi:hypothetical protein
MTGEELNKLTKIKVRPVEEQRDILLEQNMLLTGKIATLEKENAELRKDKKELCHSISEGGKACVYLNEQLTKAKFLLKQFYEHYKAKTIYVENMGVLIAEAEQFLNSEVEK